MEKDLKVLLVASESAPFIKSGGLGDVVGSLPKALQKEGVDVRVVIPRHSVIKNETMYGVEQIGEFEVCLQWRRQRARVLQKPGDVPVYFIENKYYFHRDGLYGFTDDNERFAFFGKAVLDMLTEIQFYPDVIHCNDWQTGPICMYLKEIYGKVAPYAGIKTLFTVHNLQYQGRFPMDTMALLEAPDGAYPNIEFYQTVCFMKMGLMYADFINTVSETYAKEIQTPAYGYGMDGILRSRSDCLCGILNGIDFAANNPETDRLITRQFSAAQPEKKAENKPALQKRLGLEERAVPMVAMITRLAEQKGMDILMPALDEMLRRDIQFVLLGTGEGCYEQGFRALQERYPGRASANIFFDEALAQQIYASADFFLMPSKFEPCGLGQMFSLRFGTIPIVRKTGGLADTVRQYHPQTGEGNGFLFETYDSGGLLWALDEALRIYHMGRAEWLRIVQNAMRCEYSWESSAREYIALYESLRTR